MPEPTDADAIADARALVVALAQQADALAATIDAGPDLSTDDARLEFGLAIDRLRHLADPLAGPAFHFHGMSD